MKEFDVELASAMTRLMSRENIDVRFADVPTAFCDVQNRRITFPIRFIGLDRDIMSIFSAHEVSHALYSPRDFQKEVEEFGQHVFMVLEDVRIENKIKKDFVGIIPMFARGYKRLNEEFDFFGIKSNNFDVTKLSFLDRINLKAKIRDSIDVIFSEEEQDFFDRADHAESFEDVTALCREYIDRFSLKNELLKNLQKSQEDQQKDLGSSEQTGETQEIDDDDDQSQHEQRLDAENLNQNQTSEQAEETRSGGAQSQGESASATKQEEISGSDDSTNENIENIVREILDKMEGVTNSASVQWIEQYDALKEKIQDDEENAGSQYSPRSRYFRSTTSISRILTFKEIEEKLIISWKEISEARMSNSNKINRLKEFLVSSNAKKKKKMIHDNASIMAAEFEAKKAAHGYARAKESRVGELNPNKLVHYKYSDDIFLSSIQLPHDKNHGMILIVDSSGSMSRVMKNVLFQVLVLVEYCRLVNIPYEVYAFNDSILGEKHRVNFDSIEGVIGHRRHYLNWFSSRMTKREYDQAFDEVLSMQCNGFEVHNTYLDSYCGTPLNEVRADAIALTDDFVNRTRVEKFSIVYLTDGAGGWVRMSDMVSWKNKMFYDRAHSSEEYLYKLYKKIYPNFNVINLFLTHQIWGGSENNKRRFLTDGFYSVKYREHDAFATNAFDINYRINTRIMQRMSSSMSGKTLDVDSEMDLEESLDNLKDSFLFVSRNKKKMNVISRSIASHLS